MYEKRRKTGVKVAYLVVSSASTSLVPEFAQSLHGRTSELGHGATEFREFLQRQRPLSTNGSRQARHGLASASDDHLLPSLYLIEEFTQASFRLSQINGLHIAPHWS